MTVWEGQIREVFETFDADGSGEIDVDELFIAMRAMNEPFQSKEDGMLPVKSKPCISRVLERESSHLYCYTICVSPTIGTNRHIDLNGNGFKVEHLSCTFSQPKQR